MILRILGGIVSLPLMFFVPGYVLLRGRLFDGIGSSWVERLLLTLLLSTSVTSLFALLMAETGYLRIWLLDLVLAVFSVLARLVFGSTPRRVFWPRPGRWEIVAVVLLLVLALGMFFRPAEYVVGEGDPGYYFNIGYNLAHTGELTVHEPTVPGMSDVELRTFYSSDIAQFFPFHLRDRATGRIQPLLYHLLPTWTGIFIMMFGTFGGLYVTPLFALLGLLAIFGLSRRFGGPVGAVTAGLLGVVFTLSMWFARIPLSEMMGQFYVIGALLLFAWFSETRNTLAGLGCALAATCAALVRPEAALLFVPLLGVMFFYMFVSEWRRAEKVMVNSLLAGAAIVLLYIKLREFEYVSANFGKVVRVMGSQANMNTLLLACAAVVAVALVVFNIPPLQRRLARWGASVERRFARNLAVFAKIATAVIALFVFAAFAWLYNFGGSLHGARTPQKMFINTAALLGGAAVFVFVLGLCYMLFESRLSFAFTASVMVLGLSVGVQESSLALGQYPWDSRRFMTLTVPLLLAGFGYLCYRVWNLRGPIPKAGVVAATAGFLVAFCLFSAPLYNLVEFKGVDARLTELAGRLDGDRVVGFCDQYVAELFGIPLRYQHGVDARKVAVLNDPWGLYTLVRSYQEQGRTLLVDTNDPKSLGVPFNRGILSYLKFVPAFEARVTYPHLEPVPEGRPSKTVTVDRLLTFYTVEPRGVFTRK